MVEIKNNDAYKIMYYQCENEMCKRLERIWNSRNAVSPFTVGCPICGSTMSHVFWNEDVFNQNYVPLKGQRYFADYTRERAEKVAKAYIDRFQKTEYALPEVEVENAFYQKMHELMHGGCSMDILTKE
jgi:hypothetical protein